MSPKPVAPDAPCACCSGRTRQECCGPFLDRLRPAPTAEALMRARYSAFAEGKVAFIRDTLAESARKDHDEEGIRRWSSESEWLGLEVLSTERGAQSDQDGIVEFVARYRAEGRIVAHRERAQFAKEGGAWVFVDSETPKPGTFRREEPKIQRNDPCPCGSGRKHKKCCGAA